MFLSPMYHINVFTKFISNLKHLHSTCSVLSSLDLHSFEENKQIRSEKGIHFEDVMFTFTRSLRLVTLFYANAFMSFSAVTCGILVVFCFYIKFSCVFMFFQIKINHRFEPHRYQFRMVADLRVLQHGLRPICSEV